MKTLLRGKFIWMLSAFALSYASYSQDISVQNILAADCDGNEAVIIVVAVDLDCTNGNCAVGLSGVSSSVTWESTMLGNSTVAYVDVDNIDVTYPYTNVVLYEDSIGLVGEYPNWKFAVEPYEEMGCALIEVCSVGDSVAFETFIDEGLPPYSMYYNGQWHEEGFPFDPSVGNQTCNSIGYNGQLVFFKDATGCLLNNGEYYDEETGMTAVLDMPLKITVMYSDTDSIQITQGDSVFVGGGWQLTGGWYVDTLTSGNGCDSIIHTYVEIVSGGGSNFNESSYIWSQAFGGNQNDEASFVRRYGGGYLVFGRTESSALDIQPGIGETNVQSTPSFYTNLYPNPGNEAYASFIAEYSSNFSLNVHTVLGHGSGRSGVASALAQPHQGGFYGVKNGNHYYENFGGCTEDFSLNGNSVLVSYNNSRICRWIRRTASEDGFDDIEAGSSGDVSFVATTYTSSSNPVVSIQTQLNYQNSNYLVSEPWLYKFVSVPGRYIIGKYTSEADLEWVYPSFGWSPKLTDDPSDNLYIAARLPYGDSLVDVDPQEDSLVVSRYQAYSGGVYERSNVLVKWSSDAEAIWAVTFGGPSISVVRDIKRLESGNIVVFGVLYNINGTFSMNTNPASPSEFLETTQSQAMFLACYSSDGQYVWSKLFGSNYGMQGTSIDVDGDLVLLNTVANSAIEIVNECSTSELSLSQYPRLVHLIIDDNGAILRDGFADVPTVQYPYTYPQSYLYDSASVISLFHFSDTIYMGADTLVSQGLNDYVFGRYELGLSQVSSTVLSNTLDSLSICDGDSVFLGASFQTESGTFIDTVLTSGCAEIVTTVLSVDSGVASEISNNGWFLKATNVNGVFYWIDCATDSLVDTTHNYYYMPSYNGNFKVSVDIGAGCIDTSTCIAFTASTNKTEGLVQFAGPSPTTQHFDILFEREVSNLEVNIFSLQGQLMYEEHIGQTHGVHLNLSNYAEGYYLIQLASDQGTQTLRVLKSLY